MLLHEPLRSAVEVLAAGSAGGASGEEQHVQASLPAAFRPLPDQSPRLVSAAVIVECRCSAAVLRHWPSSAAARPGGSIVIRSRSPCSPLCSACVFGTVWAQVETSIHKGLLRVWCPIAERSGAFVQSSFLHTSWLAPHRKQDESSLQYLLPALLDRPSKTHCITAWQVLTSSRTQLLISVASSQIRSAHSGNHLFAACAVARLVQAMGGLLARSSRKDEVRSDY